MKKGQKRNSKQIIHEFDQSFQQNQQQYQQLNPHKDILFFACVEKAIFLYLRQNRQQLIQSILCRQLTNEYSQKKTIKKDHLLSYLKRIQQPSFQIRSQMFKQAFTVFKSLFLHQIANIWEKLSQQQQNKYEQFGMRNRQIMKQFEREQNGHKYSGFQMLKVDALCVFFFFNNHFAKPLENTSKKLISDDLLAKLFEIDRSHIAKMSFKFKQHQKNIHIVLWRELRLYVELLALIKLAYKVHNYGKSKFSFQNIPVIHIQLNIKDQIYTSNNPEFHFSQIAYIPIESMQRRKQSYRSLQAQFPKINHERKTLLRQISKQYNIPYYILLKINNNMNNKLKITKQLFVASFEKTLQKCQWIYLKEPSTLVEGINAAFGDEFPGVQRYRGNHRIKLMSIVTNLAAQRFALLPKIFNMQIKVEQKLSIYVYKFQYCLKYFQFMKQKNQQHSDQQADDLRCSLVILVANSQILAYSFCRNALTHDLYINLVKLCLKAKVINQTNQFNLVMYDFDYENTIHIESFKNFQIYMNSYFGTRVYILNDPLFFQPHFLVDSFLRSFLSTIELSKQNFYQYFEVCTAKLLKGIQNFDKKTNEQYFAYFKKIMSLEIGIRDVWKCFKKDRGNRFNAVLLSAEDIEQECPSNFRLMLKAQIPTIEWINSIQHYQPNLQNFTSFQERERWRIIEPYTEHQSKGFESFLQRKHMRENCIRRILRDVTRFLIDYQLFFRQLVSGQRPIKQGPQIAKSIDWLKNFYDQQNKKIEQVYSPAYREAIFKQFAKKYEKQEIPH